MNDNDISLDHDETTWLVNLTLSIMTGSVLLTVASVTLIMYALLS